MDKNKEKAHPKGSSLSKRLKEQTKVFDIINSKDLENLFQKNAHLLTRISTTQRRNTVLQKELFSLIEEKSKLGLKNNILNEEVSALKEKVTFFKDKQEQFKEQSSRLKQILNHVTPPPEQKENEGEAPLLRERLHAVSRELTHHILYRGKVQNAHKSLKSRLQRKIQRIQVLETLQSDLQEQIKILDQKNKELNKALHSTPNNRELKILKQNYSDLQRALAQQQEGFAAALRATRKRHLTETKTIVKEKETELKNQMEKMGQLKTDLQKSEQALQSARENGQQEISRLKQELKVQEKGRKRAEEEIRALTSKHQSQLSDKEQKYKEKLTKLHGELQTLSDQKKTEHLREREALKAEYEHRIKGLTEAHERKLKNICTEMENDLCAEKRRTEMLQSEREEEVKRLEENTQNLLEDIRQLTVRNQTLERSNQEASERIKKEISANENLKYQHKQIRELWQNLQAQVEKRNQQVEALQKLNRSLSVQLNERNRSGSNSPSYFSEENQTDEETSTPSNKHPLADIHFS